MCRNPLGDIAQQCWDELAGHYPILLLDEFVVMPNHIHLILIITDFVGIGSPNPKSIIQSNNSMDTSMGANPESEYHESIKPIRSGGETPPLQTLDKIIAYYKYQSTKQMNLFRQSPGTSVWQRNYYDRIIRNEKELNAIRQYIFDNPFNWVLDKQNPQSQPKPFIHGKYSSVIINVKKVRYNENTL